MSDEPQSPSLPDPEVWRSRLAAVRRRASGLRSFAESLARLLRESAAVGEVGLFWSGDDDQGAVHAVLGTASLGGISRLQRQSFEKAIRAVLTQGSALYLEPGRSSDGSPADDIESRPWTAADLPLYNNTAAAHAFYPVRVGGRVAGCLHAARLSPGKNAAARLRPLLEAAASETGAFFRDQSPEKASRLAASLASRAKLLESVLGENDLAEFGLQVVNHIQSLLGCSRVCLFSPANARGGLPLSALAKGHSRFRIRAASGLVEVVERSAEAVFLKDLAQVLLSGVARQAAAEKNPAAASKPIIGIAGREPPEEGAERDPLLTGYFEETASDWVAALALRGDDGLIFGMLLLEGRGALPDVRELAENLAPLEPPLGRSLERVLAGQGLRGALATRIAAGSRRRLFGWMPRWAALLLLAALIGGILAWPVSFDVRADARVFADDYRTLSAPFRAPVASVSVGLGDQVEPGEVLAALDASRQAFRRLELAARQDRENARRRIALAEGREDEAVLAELETRVIASELQLLDRQIAESVFRAPYEGVVVGPANLRHRVGSYVNEGDAVVELAGESGVEMVLYLREQDLLEVRRRLDSGEEVAASFRPTADSLRQIPFTLSPNQVYPLFSDESEPGILRYGLRVPVDSVAFALPDDAVSEYTGKATLDLGHRSLGFVVFRDFIHFIRIRFL